MTSLEQRILNRLNSLKDVDDHEIVDVLHDTLGMIKFNEIQRQSLLDVIKMIQDRCEETAIENANLKRKFANH